MIDFADARDPIFNRLKAIISKDHALPTDLLKDAETVISYFLPFEKEIPLSNVGGDNSSRKWALAYVETNKLIVDLNKALSEMLKEFNFSSFILPPTHNFDREKLISDWSHKHVAYIAGLGNFGIHQMLITERGCCGRLGSLITNAKIKPTERTNKEFCLYKHDRSCEKCVEKCTFGALKIDSFDRHKCHEVCLYNDRLYFDLDKTDVCGKCVCVVPCSFVNPLG
ncbi:MAG: epoxyqueuosine reductase [Candidatus Methanofastidiosia archaeon]